MLVDDGGGEAANHEVGDRMHADDEGRNAERDAAAARRLAGGHHRHPIAPGEPQFVAREPDSGAGLDHGVTLLSSPARRGRGDRALARWRGQACSVQADTSPHRRAELVIGPATSGRTRWLASSPVNGGGYVQRISRGFRRLGDEGEEGVFQARIA